MIDNYYYRPLRDNQPDPELDRKRARPKKHGSVKKRIALFLLFLILLVAALLVAGYFYLRFLPLDNEGGRTNIAIIGVDDAAKLSDTIMVVSIDETNTQEPRAAIVSIPRDFYVPIPGIGLGKINASYAYGENTGYEGGGAALTRATLEENLAIPIHYYAALDFSGFEEIIDALGGVTVDVKRSIDDPYFPAPGYAGYDPFSISTGVHTMDGETALKYVRSRQTTNDFDRAFRQQQVVLAVKSKVINTELLLDRQALTEIIQVVKENVETDFNRYELLKLTSIVRELEGNDVPQYVIDTSNLLVGTNNETGSALIPRAGNYSEIQQFMRDIFDQSEVKKFEQLQF